MGLKDAIKELIKAFVNVFTLGHADMLFKAGESVVNIVKEKPEAVKNPGAVMAEVASEVLTDEAKERLKPALDLLEYSSEEIYEKLVEYLGYSGVASPDKAEEAVKRYFTLNLGLNSLGIVSDLAGEVLSLGQVDALGRAAQGLYWSLGLGWLSWATLSPFMNAAVTQPLSWKYNALYRPRLLSKSEIIDMWRYGLLEEDNAKDELAKQGYSDEKISKLLEYEKRKVEIDAIEKEFKKDIYGEEEAKDALLKLGIPEDLAEKLVHLWALEKMPNPKDLTTSQIIDLYEYGIIGRDEALEMLQTLGYSTGEAELLLTLQDYKEAAELTKLKISSIREQFVYGDLSEEGARQSLIELGIRPEKADALVELWKLQKERRVKKLTESSIKRLWKTRVYDDDKAINALKELGYPRDVAEDILKAWKEELKPAEKEAKEKKLPPRPSDVLYALKRGEITEEEATEILKSLGWSDDRIRYAILRVKLAPKPGTKTVSKEDIARAYKYGLLSFDETVELLEAIGYNSDAAQLIALTYALQYKKARITETGEWQWLT